MEYLLAYAIAVILGVSPITPQQGWHRESGRLSVYWPGDGHNHGKLTCGGEFTRDQVHIAYRKWWKVGCGRRVLVCAKDTGRCELARVMDAGPFGIYTGALKHAKPEGRWKIYTGSRPPPKGWQYRAAVDLSVALWKRLGQPRSLSNVTLTFLPRGAWSHLLEDLVAARRPPEVS